MPTLLSQILTFLCLTSIAISLSAQPSDRYAYIDQFKHLAVEEMYRTGIPASIKLGQGILESGGGTSELARKANNHFGIKCGPGWNGGTFYREDDDYHNGKLIKSCFRAFANAEECYRAHSDFLTDPNKSYRYGFLFDLDPLDYKAWAKGLHKAGYATSKTYAEKLINVIEQYQLHELDNHSHGIIASRPEKRPDQSDKESLFTSSLSETVMLVNDVKVVVAQTGQTPEDIAAQTRVKVWRLLKYNEQLNTPEQTLQPGERIYLQPKRNNYREREKWHQVQEGQSLFDISQLYGLKLEKLYKHNRMAPGEEPATGERIRLRGKRKDAPKLRSSNSPEQATKTKPEEEQFLLEEPAPNHSEPLEIAAPTQPNNSSSKPGTPSPSNNRGTYHEVAPGDTLYSISRRYQTTVAQLQELNNLTDTLISPGQRIRVK